MIRFSALVGLLLGAGLLILTLGLLILRQQPVQGAWLFSVDSIDGQIYRRWLDLHSLRADPERRVTQSGGVKQNLSAAPDGRWLVFSTFNAGYYNLFTMRTNGHDLRPLTNRSAWDTMPAWSPDGAWVAFASDIDISAELYRLRVDGSRLERLTDNLESDTMPAWSPDGAAVVFQSTRHHDPELYRLTLTDGAATRLTEHPGYDGQPDWSPNGQWIAFTSQRGEDDNFHIYRMNADGSQVQRLSDPGSGVGFYDPKWSPGGEWLAYWGGHPGQFGIYLVRADGSQRYTLDYPTSMLAPEWSPLAQQSWAGGWLLVIGLGLLALGRFSLRA
jgi:TolB protein